MSTNSQNEEVLFVIFQLGLGGVEGEMRSLANYLVERGLPIDVFALCKKTLDIDIQKLPNAPVYWGDRRNRYDPLPVLQLCNLFKQLKPSVIVCFDRHSWIYCLLARKITGQKIPILARSLETRGLISWRAEIQLHLAMLFLLPEDRIVALSASLKSQLIKRWKFSVEKIQLIPIGVDLERFSPESLSRLTGMREELGIPAKSGVIVQIGNLSKNKNQEFAIGLMRDLIIEKKMNVYLVLVGGGSRKRWQELHDLALGYGISERVIFAGVQEDVRSFLAIADVLLLCSKAEATPNVVLESLACKIPVLVSRYDSAEEQLGSNLTDWVVSLVNIDEFRDKLVRLLCNPELREAVGEIGYQHVKSQFTIQAAFQRWESLIQSTIGEVSQ
jgi:glycosyltransferase involved in cell wall biosynthesis